LSVEQNNHGALLFCCHLLAVTLETARAAALVAPDKSSTQRPFDGRAKMNTIIDLRMIPQKISSRWSTKKICVRIEVSMHAVQVAGQLQSTQRSAK
jgi:hypothetical protein